MATVGQKICITGDTAQGGIPSFAGTVIYPVSDNLTAHAGGGQASALLLTSTVNRVTTVASGNDSVALPLAVAGSEVKLINGAGVNSLQVFGSGTDIINDVATATGVAQLAGKAASYFCTTSAPAGKWYRVLSA